MGQKNSLAKAVFLLGFIKHLWTRNWRTRNGSSSL